MNIFRRIRRAITRLELFWNWCSDPFNETSSWEGENQPPCKCQENAPTEKEQNNKLVRGTPDPKPAKRYHYHRRTDQEHTSTLKTWLEIFGIVGGIIGVAFIAFQSCEMDKTVQIASGQLQASIGQLNEMRLERAIDNMPWMGPFSEAIYHQPDGSVYFEVKIQNFGKAPAKNVTMWLGQETNTNAVAQFEPTNTPETFSIFFPGSGGALNTFGQQYTMDMQRYIKETKLHLYLTGLIKYDDIAGQKHWTRYCWDVSDFTNLLSAPFGNSCDTIKD